MNHEIEIRMAMVLGIGVKYMTIHKAELVQLKNDGLTVREIAKILDTGYSRVQAWYDKDAQPKVNFIEKLEKMYFKRSNN